MGSTLHHVMYSAYYCATAIRCTKGDMVRVMRASHTTHN
ncbi:hypothetical protein HMPREF9248_0693 [Fannyhessea vaginae PB189-T1-4]|uniref:Uncharacterized protein n=1 Tax=Fannyhessea vaginae PB189-T1-4 TaxID=866774 RepID=A0ABP2J0C7_9ACTN|nr:hypothetical protein HMPREF9248_0693 [Fannyhessea vaginae PB189-T1-4]